MLKNKDKSTISNGRKKKKLFKSEKRKVSISLFIVIGILVAIIAVFVLGILSSRQLVTKNFIIEYGNLPQSFDGYKIVQVTDYHLGVYANSNTELVAEIKKAQPDIIVMTGDFIDSSSKNIDNISELAESLRSITAVLWIKGNHFYKCDEKVAASLQDKMDSLDVISLTNECYTATIEDESISFFGVDDPERLYSASELPGEYIKTASKKAMERFLDELDNCGDESVWFKVLLSHRYSMYENFQEHGYSLALAGHSHGGQLKLPWGIDLIGYNLKLFPSVKSGYNDINGMPLIVSSGLGTSNINLRLYNPPEIVVVELKVKND